MRYLLIGGAGYVGSSVAWMLKQQAAKNQVWIYDDLSTGTRNNAVKACDKVIVGDQLDVTKLTKTMRAFKPDVVMHFAAKIIVSESVAKPLAYWHNNVGGMMNVLQAMHDAKVKHLVFSSTAAVYGTPQSLPVSEDAVCKPINPYGASKLACEALIQDCARAYGINAVIFRYFNIAGANVAANIGLFNEQTTLLIPRAVKAAILNETFSVFGNDYDTPDGTCVRDYIHVTDLARAHLAAVTWLKSHTGVLIANLSSAKGYSVQECLDAVSQVVNHPLKVQVMPRRAGDPVTLIATHTVAMKELGWKPEQSLLDMVKSEYAFRMVLLKKQRKPKAASTKRTPKKR